MNRERANKSFAYVIKYILFAIAFSALVAGFVFLASYFQKDSARSEPADLEGEAKPPIIVIDAGHGGEDGGAVGVDGVTEKELNLEIALELADMLRAAGFEVVLTRDDDRLLYDPMSDYKGRKKQLDLAKRLQIGESFEDAIFVSIHMNSFTDPKYKGLQVYFSPNTQISESLADSIQSSVATRLQTSNQRSVKKATSRIFILNEIQKPAVLVECAFLSNPEECRLIATSEYRKKLTFCIFAGICEFISENSY